MSAPGCKYYHLSQRLKTFPDSYTGPGYQLSLNAVRIEEKQLGTTS